MVFRSIWLPDGFEVIDGTDRLPSVPAPETADSAANVASSIISGQRPMLQAPSPARSIANPWPAEVVKSYIAAYYYAALTNVSFQFYLAPLEQLEENYLVKQLLDASYKDFCTLDGWFATLDPKELQANPNLHLFEEARNGWKPWVRDSMMIYNERAKIPKIPKK